MDHCKSCFARGDINVCKSESCYVHNDNGWYAEHLCEENEQLLARVEELESEIVEITDRYTKEISNERHLLMVEKQGHECERMAAHQRMADNTDLKQRLHNVVTATIRQYGTNDPCFIEEIMDAARYQMESGSLGKDGHGGGRFAVPKTLPEVSDEQL